MIDSRSTNPSDALSGQEDGTERLRDVLESPPMTQREIDDARWRAWAIQQPCPYGSGRHTWTPHDGGRRCPSCGLAYWPDGRVEIG
jgi:hypothetical protein